MMSGNAAQTTRKLRGRPEKDMDGSFQNAATSVGLLSMVQGARNLRLPEGELIEAVPRFLKVQETRLHSKQL